MFSSTSEFPGDFPSTFSQSGLLEEALPTVTMMMTEDQQITAAGIMCQQFKFINCNCSYSRGGGCGSLASYYSNENNSNIVIMDEKKKKPLPSLIQRSLSSHSLPTIVNDNVGVLNYPPVWHHGTDDQLLLMNLIDSGPFRRVFSTGDLQIKDHQQKKLSRSESPLSYDNSSSSSSIIEGVLSQACRYTPEEKKDRIERYKSKRSQRNFNKKIKYACRKTLADSRPRIRGRFARNDENNNEEEVENVDHHQQQDYHDQLIRGRLSIDGQVVEWGNIRSVDDQYQESSELGRGYLYEDDDDNWVSLLNNSL